MTTATTTDDALQAPAVGRYAIDRRASTITFKSRHLFGLAPVHGTMAIGGGLVDIADPLTGPASRSRSTRPASTRGAGTATRTCARHGSSTPSGIPR